MKKKLHVGIIFGGRSAEHEVSVHSAKNIVNALDKSKYDITLIGIDHHGVWHFGAEAQKILDSKYPQLQVFHSEKQSTSLQPKENNSPVAIPDPTDIRSLDVVFPILHGPFGEDGTMQGLLKLAGKAFVGSSVLGSAVSMDKDVMKRLLREAGIPVVKFRTYTKNELNELSYNSMIHEFGSEFFLKPANLGSSIGVHKVVDKKTFSEAIDDAFKYDRKILIEEFIEAREIECSVLGNDNPIASIPGEIIPNHEFYSYESKYLDENGAIIEIPAKLTKKQIGKIHELAIKSFKVLSCEGLARVDFFLEKKTGELYVNEINTLPGFTNISMYPKLWEHSGISYSELIDKLIELAIERYNEEKLLKTTID